MPPPNGEGIGTYRVVAWSPVEMGRTVLINSNLNDFIEWEKADVDFCNFLDDAGNGYGFFFSEASVAEEMTKLILKIKNLCADSARRKISVMVGNDGVVVKDTASPVRTRGLSGLRKPSAERKSRPASSNAGAFGLSPDASSVGSPTSDVDSPGSGKVIAAPISVPIVPAKQTPIPVSTNGPPAVAPKSPLISPVTEAPHTSTKIQSGPPPIAAKPVVTSDLKPVIAPKPPVLSLASDTRPVIAPKTPPSPLGTAPQVAPKPHVLSPGLDARPVVASKPPLTTLDITGTQPINKNPPAVSPPAAKKNAGPPPPVPPPPSILFDAPPSHLKDAPKPPIINPAVIESLSPPVDTPPPPPDMPDDVEEEEEERGDSYDDTEALDLSIPITAPGHHVSKSEMPRGDSTTSRTSDATGRRNTTGGSLGSENEEIGDLSSVSVKAAPLRLPYDRKSVRNIVPPAGVHSKSPTSALKNPVQLMSHVNHVVYDYYNARYVGVPVEWKDAFNKQFGTSLESLPKVEVEGYEHGIPALLVMLERELVEKGGLDQVGIFRLAPDKDECNYVKKQIDGGTYDGKAEVNVLANLIKVFLRELPINILNVVDEDTLIQAAEMPPATVGLIVNEFPEPNRSVLLWLADLMARVVKNEEVNKMTFRNMAIVISPNLFFMNDSEPMHALIVSQKIAQLTGLLIKWRCESQYGFTCKS